LHTVHEHVVRRSDYSRRQASGPHTGAGQTEYLWALYRPSAARGLMSKWAKATGSGALIFQNVQFLSDLSMPSTCAVHCYRSRNQRLMSGVSGTRGWSSRSLSSLCPSPFQTQMRIDPRRWHSSCRGAYSGPFLWRRQSPGLLFINCKPCNLGFL